MWCLAGKNLSINRGKGRSHTCIQYFEGRYTSALRLHSGQTQRAYAIWADVMAANCREIQYTFAKSLKINQLLEREALTLSVYGNVPVCLPLTLSPRTLSCHCISSKAFLRTSLHKRFELRQIFKALTTGCDVGFCFWPLWTLRLLVSGSTQLDCQMEMNCSLKKLGQTSVHVLSLCLRN